MTKTIRAKVREEIEEATSNLSPRAQSILQDAIRLITEEGYGEFTLRKVASRNGIKLASLQYHFKTKEELLGALLNQVLREYGERFSGGDPAAYASIPPRQLLELTIDFILAECQDHDASRFFFQLWAMSCYEPAAAAIQEKIYAIYREIIAELIAEIRPGLSAAEVKTRSMVIVSMLEGTMLFISKGKAEAKRVAPLAKEVKRSIFLIIGES